MKRNNSDLRELNTEQNIQIPRKKMICGLIVFILAFMAPLLLPLVLMLNITPASKTLLSGLLIFGIPEIGMLLAVVILGKEGYIFLKTLLLSRLKQTVMVNEVSRLRYRIGIILFSATFIINFLMPYINYFSSIRMSVNHYYAIFLFDFLFFISLLILGGNFWDKLKALFVYDVSSTA